MAKTERFTLTTNRLGPLPIVNHFLERLELEELIDRFVPTRSARTKLPYSKALGVLLRSILVEREPIYRQQEVVAGFAPRAFGLDASNVGKLSDDSVGRALDRLFVADRGSLLTAAVVSASKRFGVRFDELHNDSTTIRVSGQYRSARGRSIRGKKAPFVTYGFSKDHRPDLKQLLFILTTSSDGGVPVQFRCEAGNTNDSTTHLETWRTLCEVSGRKDFLYVADSKLCSMETMETIHREGGRFITVLPRSRQEDGHFRKWSETKEPEWETVWDRPNPRQKYGPRDVWKVYRYPIPSQEGWPITWVFSTLLRLHQGRSRQERITRGVQEIETLQKQLAGPRPRLRSPFKIEQKVEEIVGRLRIRDYLRPWVTVESEDKFRQESPGRPGRDTRYRKETKRRLSLQYEVDQGAIDYDQRTDGMYPLLTNDRKLTPAQVLEAHKRQPEIEKRFEQLKSVHEIAPVFLKNEARVEALFFLYFLALMVQALIEREARLQMKENGLDELPLYPEDRSCRRPTVRRIFQLFSTVSGHTLLEDGDVVQVFQPDFTSLQRQLLELLDVPQSSYVLTA